MFVHAFNVFVSDLVSHHSSNNACVSYFLNILIDTTLGALYNTFGAPTQLAFLQALDSYTFS
jgi:hypothetical protein